MSNFIDTDRIDWRLIIPTNPTTAEENMIYRARKLVESQPTADVVEVVRCKDDIYPWYVDFPWNIEKKGEKMPTENKHEIKVVYAVYADGRKEPIVIDEIKDLSLEEAEPILEEHNFVKVTRCENCMHAEIDKYAPAECQFYCTLSLQYHGGRFFCACGERGTDLLEWIHRGDDDEQGV